MGLSQQIVVCTEDGVLAKKVRFLLARDECEVEILSSASKLEERLEQGAVALLVLSRRVLGEDALLVIERLSQAVSLPRTLVLGGETVAAPDFVSIVTDAADTQAIYRTASEALANPVGHTNGYSLEPLVEDEELDLAARAMVDRAHTHRAPTIPAAALPENIRRGGAAAISEAPPESAIVDANGMRGDDSRTARRKAKMEPESMEPENGVGEAEPDDVTVFDVARYHAPANNNLSPVTMGVPSTHNLGLAGPLEPGRFAKALFQCWTMEARGALVLANDREKLTVYFNDGFPVHVESNISGNLLGRSLVSKHKLTDAQYSDAAKVAIERGVALGQAVVELGFMSRDTLGYELGEDAHERIVQRFSQRSGAFEFDPTRPSPIAEQPYRIPVGRILVDGLKRYCDDSALASVVGEIETHYFKLRSPIEVLAARFPLTEREKEFLAFSGRAYNMADAAEVSGLDRRGARVLMALLTICEETEDFVPGVVEFEIRIREERERQTKRPGASDGADTPFPRSGRLAAEPEQNFARSTQNTNRVQAEAKPSSYEQGTNEEKPFDRYTYEKDKNRSNRQIPASEPAFPSDQSGPFYRNTPSAQAENSSGTPPPSTSNSSEGIHPSHVRAEERTGNRGETPSANGVSIPPMPVPLNGGRSPRSVVFSPPLPRGPDGMPQETAERTRSRQHFQRGVTLLGQGNFDDAEEAFRDAIALCAEEHVYLIGLARAIYYNPSYSANGKVPILRSIVDRATHLAPEDARVTTLNDWITHAEYHQRT